MSQKTFLTFDEAVAELNLPPEQLRKWVSEKQLNAYHFHNTLTFKREELNRLRSSTSGPGTPATNIVPFTDENDDSEEETNIVEIPSLGKGKEDDEDTFLEHLGKPGKTQPSPPLPAFALEKTENQPSHLIRFRCDCGKRLKAESKYSGHEITCPRCKTVMEIPKSLENFREGKTTEETAPKLGPPDESPSLPEEGLPPLAAESQGIRLPANQPEKIPSVPNVLPLQARMMELEIRLKDLHLQVEALCVQLEGLRKQNEQTRFDIARLYDLVSRLKPASSIPTAPVRETRMEITASQTPSAGNSAASL